MEFASRSDSYNSANNLNWRPDPGSQVIILGGLGAHVFKMERPENDLDRNFRSYARDLERALSQTKTFWRNSQVSIFYRSNNY